MDPSKIILRTFTIDRKTTFALLIIVIAIALLPLLAYCIFRLCKEEWTCCSRRGRERHNRERNNVGLVIVGGD